MRDNIEEYYRRNGPKLQMMITIEEPVRAQAAVYTLSRDERIATLRDELMQLEDPATYAYTRAQKARGDQPRPYEPPRRVPRPAPARNDESREVEPNATTSRPQPATSEDASRPQENVEKQAELPIHPYAKQSQSQEQAQSAEKAPVQPTILTREKAIPAF